MISSTASSVMFSALSMKPAASYLMMGVSEDFVQAARIARV